MCMEQTVIAFEQRSTYDPYVIFEMRAIEFVYFWLEVLGDVGSINDLQEAEVFNDEFITGA